MSRIAALIVLVSSVAVAQDDSLRQRPFVVGGYFDKPFVTRLFGRTTIGGYIEAVWKFERVEGITEALSFEARRFNLFTHSVVSDRIRVASELEFEHGTEEIKLEFAFVDFEIHPAASFRGGIILSPLGKFNLAHDSPLNQLTERPLVSTQIIPTALSEAGLGLYGALYPSVESRLTYEAYLVNGFNDGVLLNAGRTDVSAGRGAFEEDNNGVPSFVGRLAYSPFVEVELGLSLHTGPYNRFAVGGQTVDVQRNLSILALDWEYRHGNVEFVGEYARATIDIPPSLKGLYAESQQGVYVQGNFHFGRGWLTSLPLSKFTAVVRYEDVDFNRAIAGDAVQRITMGMNFRPTEDTVFKFGYQYGWTWSRVNVVERSAGLHFSIASYF
jgi:hypothetical protein